MPFHPADPLGQDHESAAVAGGRLRGWLARRLLAWFGRCQRDLPWRRDRDSYRIWVSEVMLQQTQVATVIGYFARFVQALPTLQALAAASEKEVLRLWEGLGYYRRARNLHRAAQLVVAEHGGVFPEDPDAAGRLPGLGRYTRNAILSQAFDQRLPILEANTLRVLSRLFGRRDDPKSGLGRRWLWQAAEALLPKSQVGSFNQGLMELGALVCTPTRPRCGECPVAARCAARRLGLQEAIPPRALAAAITTVREVAVLVRRRGRFLLVQRPADGRWAGLWEFPHGPVADGEIETAAAHRIARELAGLDVCLGPKLLTVRHGVTRYAITLLGFEAEHVGGEFASDFYRQAIWVKPGQLTDYPVSAAQRRLAHALTACTPPSGSALQREQPQTYNPNLPLHLAPRQRPCRTPRRSAEPTRAACSS